LTLADDVFGVGFLVSTVFGLLRLVAESVGNFRKAWATARRAAGLVKPKLDKNGEPVTIVVDGLKETRYSKLGSAVAKLWDGWADWAVYKTRTEAMSGSA